MRITPMLVGLMSLTIAACAADTGTYDGDVLPGPTVHKLLCPNGCSDDVGSPLGDGDWIEVGDNTFQRADTVVADQDVCKLAQDPASPCAFACQPEAVALAMPGHTCATKHCQLASGAEIVVGSCRAPNAADRTDTRY